MPLLPASPLPPFSLHTTLTTLPILITSPTLFTTHRPTIPPILINSPTLFITHHPYTSHPYHLSHPFHNTPCSHPYHLYHPFHYTPPYHTSHPYHLYHPFLYTPSLSPVPPLLFIAPHPLFINPPPPPHPQSPSGKWWTLHAMLYLTDEWPGFLLFDLHRYTNPTVTNGQMHPCQPVIMEVRGSVMVSPWLVHVGCCASEWLLCRWFCVVHRTLKSRN